MPVRRGIVFLAALALAVGSNAYAQGGEDSIAGMPVAMDGDTLRFGALRVDINGIDAPEWGQSCRDRQGRRYDCGLAARTFLDGLLEGRALRCRLYNRTPLNTAIGDCETDQGGLTEAMIASGWAIPVGRGGAPHAALAIAAKEAERGLYQGGYQTPAAWRRGFGQQRAGGGLGPCKIKGNIGGDGARRYFTQADPDYDRVVVIRRNGERWFCSREEAIAAGFRMPGPRCQIKGVIAADGRRVYYTPEDRFYGEIAIDPDEGDRLFCSAGEAYRAGYRNCLIKGVVEADGRRVYYRQGAEGYVQAVVDARRGGRWLCTVQMARRAGFPIAAPLDPEITGIDRD